MLGAVREKIEGQLSRVNVAHLRESLIAWWNGIEGPMLLDEVVDDGDSASVRKPAKKKKYPEPTEEDLFRLRTMICDALWGEGYVGPGSREFVMECVSQFGLTKERSVAFIEAGLGGPARDISKESGAWISAFESKSPILAAGKEQCAIAGLAKRVVMEPFDEKTTALPENKFHAVISFDRFYAVEDKSKLLDNIANGMSDDGSVLFTDYVVPSAVDKSEAEKWFDPFWGTPHLTTAQEYIQTLSAMGLDLRVKQDITLDYAAMINAAMPKWKELINLAQAEEIDGVGRAAYARVLAEEAGRWASRLEALSKGQLQVYRFLAIKLG